MPTRSGGLETLHLVQGLTVVNTEWLLELAPQHFSSRRGKTYYDPRAGALMTRQLVRFGGRVLEGASDPVEGDSPKYRREFNDAFATYPFCASAPTTATGASDSGPC
ncbi:hypothetical protein D3C86_1676560 [compost metagenome]